MKTKLKYAENSHLDAYIEINSKLKEANIPNAKILNRSLKDLSYNNIVDAAAALYHIKGFKDYDAACLIIKHAYPISIATGDTVDEALKMSHTANEVPALGGLISVNTTFTVEAAEYVINNMGYTTAIIAPKFDKKALDMLNENKKSTILFEVGSLDIIEEELKDEKKILGATLEQDRNLNIYATVNGIQDLFKEAYMSPNAKMTKKKGEDEGLIGVVTKKMPKLSRGVYDFAWRAARHTRSNGTSLVWEYEPGKFQTVGLGGGQGMRSLSLRIAIMVYQDNKQAFPEDVLSKAVFGSDSFFFQDAVEIAANNGITNIISSGGGIKSQEVIDLCNKLEISMIYTGVRCFEHRF